jgi:hypothetical protein
LSFTLAPIVEGHGDVAAVRVLIQRMSPALIVARPVRFPRNRLLQDETLLKAARIAASNIRSVGAVLLLIDSDADCAKQVGPELRQRLERILPNHVCRTAVAVREFESWIVGGHPVYAVADPDNAGAPKQRIAAMRGVYKESVDQPKLIANADLDRLERCSRSFRHFRKVIDELAGLAAQGP